MSFTAMLEWSVRRYRDRTVAVSAACGRSQTFGELGERAQRFANALRDLGVGKGDRILMATGNIVEYFESEFAVAKLGAVKVPILAMSTAAEVQRVVEVTEPKAILATASALDKFRSGIAHTDARRIVIGAYGDSVTAGGEYVYEDLIEQASNKAIDVSIEHDDLYAIRFTGGTTGTPKGVMMDHRSLVSLMNVMLVNWDIRVDDVCLHVHPVSHAAGFIGYAHLLRGATSVFAPETGTTVDWLLEVVNRHGVTTMFTVPTLLVKLLDSPALFAPDVSSIRQFIYGGAPIPPGRIRQALTVFGPVFVQVYGSSEAPIIASTLLPEDHRFDGDDPPAHLHSAGRPGLGVEVEVRAEDGTRCAPTEVGEIAVRGDNVTAGFWRNDELTAQRKIDGWLYTGDIGYQDEDGYLYLKDRKEDMIISGGFNVWPNEVENAIATHPAVQEAVVFGVPDDYWGEAVMAAVVLRTGTDPSVDGEAIRAYLVEQLAKFQIPKRVIVRQQLPKSGIGKLLRSKTREIVLSELEATQPDPVP